MKTIEIYCNYGVLAAEKRNVYTFGAEHPHATCSDKMTAVIPEGWDLYQNEMGRTMITAPWGWDYDINEVLGGDKSPVFSAVDKDGREYIRTLKAIDPDAVEIADRIRNADTWDADDCKHLCDLAGMSQEWENADGMGFESVVEAAAEKLGVEIY